MGYYTYFSLSYHGDGKEIEEFKKYEPTDKDGFVLDSDRMKTLINDEWRDQWKWYDWEDDMKKLATKFPNILFVLEGDGEESGDIWEFRIKGHISEYQTVCMPPFTTRELIY